LHNNSNKFAKLNTGSIYVFAFAYIAVFTHAEGDNNICPRCQVGFRSWLRPVLILTGLTSTVHKLRSAT